VEQLKFGTTSTLEMENAIETAWNEYDSATLDHIWGVLLSCYREIMSSFGGNQYKVPHDGVRKRQNSGEDCLKYSFDCDVYNQCKEYVSNRA